MKYMISLCLLIFTAAYCSAVGNNGNYVVDFFGKKQLDNWVYYVLKWTPKGTVKIEKKDYSPVYEVTHDKNFFVKGNGALKIEHSSSAIKKYRNCYIDSIKRMNNTKLNCTDKFLVFDVIQISGGGKFTVRARDSNNKYYYLNGKKDRRTLKSIKLDYQGIKRFSLNISPLGKNGIKQLEFVFYGDFIIYLSGLEITSDKNITQPKLKNKIKFEELPEEDAT